ncbi:LPO_1073/Vpar_1526 family protein [Streptomyces sp. MUSC 14]|uniref:LPO_1073/Vpar_1526 family protein n=1 Tax=Streptomyces sp. MUSC 14 TaxID=1354889 RepID=UPI00116028DE|nr:LPO_1073/Vpar_1526 family protein [Streptomyces sp. MUSC 14]
MKKWLKQSAGSNSALIQAENISIGVGVADVEHICGRLFEERFSSYSREAYELAKERFEEFTVNYLAEIVGTDPCLLENIKDPGVQSAVMEAQCGFARSGDEDLGIILVELLVQRTGVINRDIKQLAFDEAIRVAQKLTLRHLRLVSLLFYFRNVTYRTRSYKELRDSWGIHLPPLVKDLDFSSSDAKYLLATGCAIHDIEPVSVIKAIKDGSPGLLQRGQLRSRREISEFLKVESEEPLLVPSERGPGPFEVNAQTEEEARELAKKAGLQSADTETLVSLMKSDLIGNTEIINDLAQAVPHGRELVRKWTQLGMSRLELTISGIAIAHSYCGQLYGKGFPGDIGTWIS